MTKFICFDVLGTCFGFETAIEAIQTRLDQHLATANVDARSLFFSWFFAAQRDFTYASLSGAYQPIAAILQHTFVRACRIVDLPASAITPDDVAAVMDAVANLEARPGLKRCFDGLRDAGWEVLGVTNGASAASLQYYDLAGIDMDADHLLSCDTVAAAKPDALVYENAKRHLCALGLGKQGDGERWFVAAHAWDLQAARKAGFKTAYVDYEEHDPVEEVFGKFDVYAGSMDELLQKLTAL